MLSGGLLVTALLSHQGQLPQACRGAPWAPFAGAGYLGVLLW